MGVLDAATAGIRRGTMSLAPTVPHEPPVRLIPPGAPSPMPGEPSFPVAPTERINVPGQAYPHTPLNDKYTNSYKFTQNVYNSNFNTSPGPTPPQHNNAAPDPKITGLLKADIASNMANVAQSLANNWLPTLMWSGQVQATGYKTTPLRTVVHYCLAVAYGLIKQQRISDCTLIVRADYDTNSVFVHYQSKAYWLTELLTLSLFAANGALIPPNLQKSLEDLQKRPTDALSRALTMGFKQGPNAAIIELGKEAAKFGGDAIKFIIRVYDNLGRMLGPTAVYDMGDETLYGGRASALLRSLEQPEPFKSMQTDKDGNPVPLLTRLPAANPQPPVFQGQNPSTGYSVDLRSLVAQALYDPTILPPVPDTNVSLDPVNVI